MLLLTSVPNFNSVPSVKLKLRCFSYAQHANFDQKMAIFGPKSAIMDLFWHFFSNSKNLQWYGQNETKTKSIRPPNPELQAKTVAIFEMAKFWDQKISFWAKSPEPLDILKKSRLAQQRIRFRTCGENFSPIRPASPEKSGVIRTKFPKVIVLV